MCPPPSLALEPPRAATRLRIGYLSEVLQLWMSPVMRLCGRVSLDDLPELPAEDSAAELLDAFESLWAQQQCRSSTAGRGVRRAIVRLLTPRLQLIAAWGVIDILGNVGQPLVVAAIVKNLRLGTTTASDYLLVLLLAATALVSCAALQQVLWNGARVGIKSPSRPPGEMRAPEPRRRPGSAAPRPPRA